MAGEAIAAGSIDIVQQFLIDAGIRGRAPEAIRLGTSASSSHIVRRQPLAGCTPASIVDSSPIQEYRNAVDRIGTSSFLQSKKIKHVTVARLVHGWRIEDFHLWSLCPATHSEARHDEDNQRGFHRETSFLDEWRAQLMKPNHARMARILQRSFTSGSSGKKFI